MATPSLTSRTSPAATPPLTTTRPTTAPTVPGVRSAQYRVTIFTAGGYLSCLVPDAGEADSADGSIDLFAMLRQSSIDVAGEQRLWMALRQPLTLDLDRRLPLMVEAGSNTLTTHGAFFSATHANHSPVMLRFDREYPEGIRGER